MVLRRAARPPPPRDVYIAPAFRQYEEDALAYVAVPPAIAHAAQAGADAALDPLEVFPFFKDGTAARAARTGAEASLREPSVDMHEAAELREEERADAEEDLKAMQASARAPVVLQEDSVESAARAEASEFLDTYLTSLLNDESTPARGALQSLRMRMEDAGVLPETTAASATSDDPLSSSTSGVHGKDSIRTVSSQNSVHVSMMQETVNQGTGKEDSVVVGSADGGVVGGQGEVLGSLSEGILDGGPVVDVWGAPAAGSTDAGEHGWQRRARPGSTSRQSGATEAASVHESEPFMHLGTPQDSFMAVNEQQRLRMTGRGARESEDGSFGRIREAGDEGESLMLRGRDWAQEDPEGVAASRESCSAWSRIVRKPLKRGKHVVLDLCVASRDQRSGQLERHIVAHSDRRKAWLGPAAYRLARHAKWGDLWPSIYHKNPRVRGWQ